MRLFFALWPPTQAAERLTGLARASARQFGGKPTRREDIHLTLAFLGEVPEENLPLLIRAARIVAAAPFVLRIDCLGYWRRPHLLWAGSTSPDAALGELADDLRQTVTGAGFTVADQDRAFTAHVSLLRKLPETRVPLALPAIEMISWRCSSFVLVRSQTSDAGSTYQILADFPLQRC
jgi:2'-5' RNA ligase